MVKVVKCSGLSGLGPVRIFSGFSLVQIFVPGGRKGIKGSLRGLRGTHPSTCLN